MVRPALQDPVLVDIDEAGDAAKVEELPRFGNIGHVAAGRDIYDGKPFRLKEINLASLKGPNPGEGEVGCINIGWFDNGAQNVLNPANWLADYDGIKLVGPGADKMNVRQTRAHDDAAIGIGNHRGVVEIEGATIHTPHKSRGKAIHCGVDVGSIYPRFSLRLKKGAVISTPTPAGKKRGFWGVFTYGCDLFMEDFVVNTPHNAEHGVYTHGTAGGGIYVNRCDFQATGAEGLKARPGTNETEWPGPQQALVVVNSSIGNWYQEGSIRGGAGIVSQGAAFALIWIEKTKFLPHAGHSKASAARSAYALAVSSEGNGWTVDEDSEGTQGIANGVIVVRHCVMHSQGAGNSWYGDKLMRVGRNSGGGISAKGVLLDRCGMYGENLHVQIDDAVPLTVKGCNTPRIKAFCEGLGMDTRHEAVYLRNGLHYMSEDLQAAA